MAKSNIPKQDSNPNEIDASPTKELFINMLIRDLTIEDAIGDLVDNSVDGAKRLRSNKKYNGLYINILAEKDTFSIEDNCGGISAEIARNYAFRFGRTDDFGRMKGSIGNFGIGMKRSLFKLGAHFLITSVEKKSSFTLDVDVNQWSKIKEWKFQFSSLNETKTNKEEILGTKIKVTHLNNDVANQFSNLKFIEKLKTEIERENLYNIFNGLKITINKDPLHAKQLDLLNSEEINSAIFTKRYSIPEKSTNVDLKIYAGVSDESYDDGGWYIFCNDRMILGPEQSKITGWGDGAAKYHGQYQRFRGFAFFESENADALPWNTTKNGLDLSSSIYQDAKLKMVEIMKSVLAFLNRLKEEKENDNPKEKWVLYNKLSQAKAVPIASLEKSTQVKEIFSFPNTESARSTSNEVNVSFKHDKKEVEAAKKYFKVTSVGQAGKKAFEYFIDMEIGE